MAGELVIEAELFISHGSDNFVVVAEGNQVVVSFKNLDALERLTKGGSTGGKTSSGGGGKSGGGAASGLQKLEDLNAAVREMHLQVKIVVAGKTYLELGDRSYRITMAAVLGKLGSFFRNI